MDYVVMREEKMRRFFSHMADRRAQKLLHTPLSQSWIRAGLYNDLDDLGYIIVEIFDGEDTPEEVILHKMDTKDGKSPGIVAEKECAIRETRRFFPDLE